ncbi:MAG: hypothetical protein PHD72_03440 [Patescibacteria group bacterium]|nr:hypothetical protein [Patescibacteria group bacterium]
MDQTLKLNEFFVEGDNQELSHVLLHVIQPSTEEEEKDKGYFFAVCEINDGEKEDAYNLQQIIDRIENSYYETPSEPGKNTLEAILEKINKENFSLAGPEAELTCLIGALRGNEITFSFRGEPGALLFYKNKEGGYQKMDLVAANQEEDEEDKLFSQIIQGKISGGDYFIAVSKHVADCFDHDRLQKIITGRAPEQSVGHLEKVLSGMDNGYSYGGLIIHFDKQEAAAAPTAKIDKSAERNALFETEQKTARTLSPSLFDNINTKARTEENDEETDEEKPAEKPTPTAAQINMAHLRQRTATRQVGEAGGLTNTLSIIWKGLKYAGLGIYYFFFFLAKFVVGIGRWLIMLFMVATNLQNRRRTILDAWGQDWNDFKQRLKNLPLITKILGAASIIFAVIFAGSIVYLQVAKKQAADNRIYQESFQTIKNTTDAAESAMIYGDTDGAQRESIKARDLLAVFTCQPEDKNTCDDISSRLAALTTKLRKLDTLPMNLIVDWQTLGLKAEKIYKIDNKILGISSSSPVVLVYDLLTKENKTVSPMESSLSGYISASVPKENDYVALLADDAKTVMQYDPKTNSLKKAEISYSSTQPQIKGLIVYNRRLYTLDASANQIYRHDATKAGYGLGKDWLKDNNFNLRDGIDMTVDGDMFVLKSNGEIFKFTQGVRVDFTVQGVDPALTGGDEIWTYTDLNNLYVLDSVNKRLIVLDKTGKLVRQITGAELAAPTGMVVEETKNSAYILDANKVYQLNLK